MRWALARRWTQLAAELRLRDSVASHMRKCDLFILSFLASQFQLLGFDSVQLSPPFVLTPRFARPRPPNHVHVSTLPVHGCNFGSGLDLTPSYSHVSPTLSRRSFWFRAKGSWPSLRLSRQGRHMRFCLSNGAPPPWMSQQEGNCGLAFLTGSAPGHGVTPWPATEGLLV